MTFLCSLLSRFFIVLAKKFAGKSVSKTKLSTGPVGSGQKFPIAIFYQFINFMLIYA